MAVLNETFEVTGIRCERCVNRLAAALRGHDGRVLKASELFAELPIEPPDLDPKTCEAEQQLAAGDPHAACADIVRRTWPS